MENLGYVNVRTSHKKHPAHYLQVIGFGCELGDFSPDIPLHTSYSKQCKAPTHMIGKAGGFYQRQ